MPIFYIFIILFYKLTQIMASLCFLQYIVKLFILIIHMIQTLVNSYRKNGYAILKDFLTPQTCNSAVAQINRLIEGYQPTPEQSAVFTTKNENHRTSQYFLKSSDKVRFFFEQKALKDGKLVVPKLESINKIGHALHQHNEIFKKITYGKYIGEICNQIPIKNPVVVQSMAILKPPKIGGEVKVHQDSTFLFDQPQTLVGFWIPLQDATIDNGCLWGIPGSHKGPLYERSKYNWKTNNSERQALHEVDYKDSDFVPLEMKRGSLIFFSGRTLHKSNSNTSKTSRYAYTWHLKQRDTKWASDNWLQRPKFPNFEFTNSP